MSRVRIFPLWTWVLLIVSLPFLSSAAGRDSVAAVDKTNFQLTAGYAYSRIEGDSQFVPFLGTFTLAETERHFVGAEGSLAFPISQLWGGRILASGSAQEETFDQFLGLGDESVWGWQAGIGLDAFARDPEKGHFDLGYRFSRQDSERRNSAAVDSHSLRLAAGVFTAGVGNVPIDLELSFFYTNLVGESSFFSNQEIFSLTPEVRIYASPRLRIDVGPKWRYSDINTLGLGKQHDIQGFAKISWLAPRSRSRFVLGAFGAGGRVMQEFEFGSDLRQSTINAGLELTLLFTPVDTLIQLTRQRS